MATQRFYPNQQHEARSQGEAIPNDDACISLAAQYVTGPAKDNTNGTYRVTKETNGQQIIAQIHQSTNNIERLENSRSIKESLAEAIRTQSKKEKVLRKSTISYSNKDINTKEISALIDQEWVFDLSQAPVTYWNDKEYLHCQFINPETKANFLNSGINHKPPLIGRVCAANERGEHFKRRPVRIIINNVRPAINADRVIEIIKNCTDFDSEITEVKNGSPHPVTKTRSIFFKINGHGLRILMDKLDGEIPYSDKNTPVKARLRAKINCKPWQCKECATIGIHQCEGKKCRNCANRGHTTKDCHSTTKFCGNCKKRGHRSTDAHCPTYLNEVAKEIRKMDIPIDILEDKHLRTCLAKSIQLK